MSKTKNIFITILAAAALWPAGLKAQVPGPLSPQYLPNGTTVFLMNTGTWQNDDWSKETNIATDLNGNIYVAGTFSPDGGATQRPFVRKIGPAGNELWTSTYTNTANPSSYADYGRSVCVGLDGSVYSLSVVTRATQDILVVKHNPATGAPIWAAYYDSGDWSDNAYDIVADADYAYVAGSVLNDIAIVRFASSNGATILTSYNGGDSFNAAYSIAQNGSRLALTGSIYDGRNWNVAGDMEYGNEIWTAQFNKADMALVWASTYTSSNHPEYGYDEGHAVKIDLNNNVYAAGFYYNQDSNNDIWLGKYDSAGNLVFAKTKNGPSSGYDKGFGIVLDAVGNIYVSGKVEAYNLNQGNNIWLGKYSPAGSLLSELMTHLNDETGYDVQASSSLVLVGGAFGDQFGVLAVDQSLFGAPQQLFASPGWYTGAVNLFWTYDNSGDFDYEVQYATYSSFAWGSGIATLSGADTGVTGGDTKEMSVNGLPVWLTHDAAAAAAPAPTYYFKVRTRPTGSGTWTLLGNTAAAAPNAPYNWWNYTSRGLDSFWVFNNSMAPSAALARDASGNTYVAYGNNMGGVAIVKFGPYGEARWTSFYNHANMNGRFVVYRMKLDASGNIYAIGTVSNEGSPDEDAWAAKFTPLGVKVWDRVLPGYAAMETDQLSAIAFDGSGNVLVGGSVAWDVGTNDGMLLAKLNPANGAIVSSTTVKPGQPDQSLPAEIWGLAVDASDNIYAGGYLGYVNGTAVDKDAAIIKFSSDLAVLGSTRYMNAPVSADIQSGDVVADLALSGGYIYAAGSQYYHGAGNYPNYWVAKINAADWSQVWSSTYNSVDNLFAEAYAVKVNGSDLYVAGYENRTLGIEGQKNMVLRKYALDGTVAWTKSIDGTWQDESVSAYSMEVGADGYFYLAGVFNMMAGGDGFPGVAKVAEPMTGIAVQQGYKPCSVRLAWVSDAELPAGTTFYVHYATYTGVNFNAVAAQFSFVTDFDAFPGHYIDRLVPGLDAGNGVNGMDSPNHYFRMGYKRPADVSAVEISGSTSAVPNTPGVWDRMDRYPNGNLFVVNNTHGGRNPLLRDAAGNVYTAGTFNTWGSYYVSYVRKFGPTGQPVWTRFWSDQYENSMPVIHDIALDASGNIYAAGQAGSDGSAYVNGGYSQESATGKDALLIKYGPDGRKHWARTYDFVYNSASGEDAALGLAVNSNGLYAVGYAYGLGGREAFAAKINPDTGVVDSSDTIGAINSLFNDVKLDSAGNLYAVGASSNGASGMDMLIVKADSGLAPLAQFQLNDPGEDEAYALAIDTASVGAPLLYVAGEMSVDGQQDATLAKVSGSDLSGIWASTVTYNSANENEDEALGVAIDYADGVYISGTEARYDVNQANNVFIRKYNAAGQLLWGQTLNTSGSNEDTAGGLAVFGRDVFAAVDAGIAGAVYYSGVTAVNGSGYFRHTQANLLTTNPTLTVTVSTAQAAGSGVPGVQIAVMGFSQTGGIDPNGIQRSTTGTGGSTVFSLPAGKTYFVAISSHNMVPTIKDQLSDPGGNFFVDLNTNISKQYYISPRSTTTADAVYKMTLNVSTHTGSLAVGDYIMGEAFITQTGERVGYSVIQATDVYNAMEIYNLPAAANGVYGMAVSVPSRSKVAQVFMNGAFPAVRSYNVPMYESSQLTGSFEVGASTVPPSVAGMVMDINWSPLEGARVRIERSTCAGDGYWQVNDPGNPYDDNCNYWTMLYSKETLTDAGGGFSFYNMPYVNQPVCLVPSNCTQREMAGSSYNMNVGKAGYESGYRGFSLPEGSPLPYTGDMYNSTTFNLAPATYTLTGVLKYNGMPLPNATIMVWPDWNGYSQGADSYRFCQWGGCGIRTDAKVRTGADGSFTVTGVTDGNARIEAAFEGGWRSLNEGNNYETMSDNLRVTISSQGATVPSSPPNNGCRAGRTWVLDSSGTCKGYGSVAFNIIPEGANNAGQLYGSVTFVTTYTVTGSNPLIISTSSPLTLMAQESCRDGCKNTQMSFTSLAGTFVTNTTNYTMVLSTGVTYYTKVFSPNWAQANSFKSEVEPSTTVPNVRQDFSVVRAGGLRGAVKLPDGSSFKPVYGDENSASSYWADVVVQGENVDSYEDKQMDEYGEFDFPNLAPGTYAVYLRPKGAGFVWAPARQTVTVSEGRTTDVKLQLELGLAVQPQIFGLPEVSTASWGYAIIGVPSGTEMNQKKVTDLFFSDPEYSFEYSTSTGWQTKYMPAGQYDFYLILGASYDPGGGDHDIVSYDQFGNFIGRVRGVAVQKSDTNPNIGTAAQPIAINILGSIGQGSIAGTIQGASMFTDADMDKMFGNFEELFEVIPAMMLYDSAGDLRGFSNGMPGTEASFNGFETAMQLKDKTALRTYLAANALDYGVWGLPPGRYTAVFNNPNYPPVAKEITLPDNSAYVFDFDDQQIVTAGITGVVKSSATGAALEGARVYLKHRTVEKFTLTDSSGAFSFGNLPTGIYRLEVARNGYVTEGAKTSLAGDEAKAFTMYMLPSESKLTGRIFLSKFPTQVTKAGVNIVAYDETRNVEAPESYLPKTEIQTDASGNFEITGVVPGHLYKLSAFYTGKQPEVLEIQAEEGNTVISDITLRDIPPQITIKVKKSADSASKVDVVIKSPKALVATPSCRYNTGQAFDADSAVTLALVPGPNRTYLGQFTVSSSQQYYTVKVTAGDAGNKMEKEFIYDQVSNAKTEQYIQQESLAGGAVQMDKETEEYSGIELDPGALSYSTSSATTDYTNLVGGFFSALPSVRTVKTAKGNLTIADAVKDLMASEVYNMDLSNASANKPFTLTLKYDKERGAASANSLRIYQQDADGNWQEVPGNYTVDPMLGVLSVDIASLSSASAGTSAARTPLGRKRAGMSAVVNGRYRPSATGTSQSGRFAVLTAPPIVGTVYSGSDFDMYNLPNPFSLKNKSVTLSADALASAGAYATRGTVIKYHLPAGRTGSLKFVIYNVAGEKVRSFNMGNPGAGKVHYFEWDGKNETNQDCASGVYFLMAFMDGKRLGNKAHKMAIIK